MAGWRLVSIKRGIRTHAARAARSAKLTFCEHPINEELRQLIRPLNTNDVTCKTCQKIAIEIDEALKEHAKRKHT